MAEFWNEYGGLILEGLRDTTIMVVASTIFAYIIGLPLGVLLIVTRPGGIWERPWCNRIVGWIINIGRSIPFIILMILLLDFTKFLVGTKIGVRGAIPPLVISAAPFIARMVESSCRKWTAVWWKRPSPWERPHGRLSARFITRGPAFPDFGRVHFHCHHHRLYDHCRYGWRGGTG